MSRAKQQMDSYGVSCNNDNENDQRAWEDFNPLADQFFNPAINCYSSGPGAFLPASHQPYNRMHRNNSVPFTLFVSNLNPTIQEDGLRNIFEMFGKPTSIYKKRDRYRQPIAFITYNTQREADAAIAGLNGRPPLEWEVSYAREDPNNEILVDEIIQALNHVKTSARAASTMSNLHFPFSFGHNAANSITDEQFPPCVRCGAPARFQCRCSTRYCSQECQNLDWRKHKPHCDPPPPLTESAYVAAPQPASKPLAPRLPHSATLQQLQPSPLASLSRPDSRGQASNRGSGPVMAAPPPTNPPFAPTPSTVKAEPPENQGASRLLPTGIKPIDDYYATKHFQQAATKQPAQENPKTLLLDSTPKPAPVYAHLYRKGGFSIEGAESLPVWVSFAVSPDKLFVHIKESLQGLRKLEERIAMAVGVAPALGRPFKDQPCLARYKSSPGWKRGVVEKMEKDGASVCVRFVDYGNRVLLTNRPEEVRLAEEQFFQEPHFALEVRLADVAPVTAIGWDNRVLEPLKALKEVRDVTLDCLTSNSTHCPMVRLKSAVFGDLSDYLIAKKLARPIPAAPTPTLAVPTLASTAPSSPAPAPAPVPTAVNGASIPSVEDPAAVGSTVDTAKVGDQPRFLVALNYDHLRRLSVGSYLRTSQDARVLFEFDKKFVASGAADRPAQPVAVGSLVSAFSPQLGAWFRACLLSSKLVQLKQRHRVLYTDYGNCEDNVELVRPLPVDFLQPMMAVKVTLPAGVDGDSLVEETKHVLTVVKRNADLSLEARWKDGPKSVCLVRIEPWTALLDDPDAVESSPAPVNENFGHVPIATIQSPLVAPVRAARSPIPAPVQASRSPIAAPVQAARSPISAPVQASRSPIAAPVQAARSPISAPVQASRSPIAAPVQAARSPISAAVQTTRSGAAITPTVQTVPTAVSPSPFAGRAPTVMRPSTPVSAIPRRSWPVGVTAEVMVVTATTLDSIWVQTCSAETLRLTDQIQLALQPLLESSEPLRRLPPVGSYVAAVFADDGQLYRAQILSSATDASTAEVLFVDFGNSNQVRFDQMRALPDELLKLEACCSRVALANVDDSARAGLAEVLLQIIDQVFDLLVIDILADGTVQGVLSRGGSVLNQVINKLAIESTSSDAVEQISADVQDSMPALSPAGPVQPPPPDNRLGKFFYEDGPFVDLPETGAVRLKVLKCLSPQLIHVTTNDPAVHQTIADLQVEMTKYANSQMVGFAPTEGEICLLRLASPSSDAVTWRRAACLESTEQMGVKSFYLILVDSGEMVAGAEVSDLRRIPKRFVEGCPYLAHHAILRPTQHLEVISAPLMERTAQLLPDGCEVDAEIVGRDAAAYVVEIPSVTNLLRAESLLTAE